MLEGPHHLQLHKPPGLSIDLPSGNLRNLVAHNLLGRVFCQLHATMHSRCADWVQPWWTVGDKLALNPDFTHRHAKRRRRRSAGLRHGLIKISTGGLHTLDKRKFGGCTLRAMLRVLTIGLAVVVMLSCATVLITPDLGDDTSAVLHQHHSVRGHKLSAAPSVPLRPFALATFHSFNSLIPTLHSSTPRLRDLVCVRLC